ncbi:MaoC family dehydratase N-terminal domain-containing protein [Deltaproteobacteria bacterium]|nr:MaoC family dehydratase N-terminal domain-containing protein [Deltaproteobacteria bacterium]
MAISKDDKIIDEYVADRNSHIGDVWAAQLGEYPPKYENLYGGLMNEWVTTDVIRHYVDAIGDRNPLWRSDDYARTTRWGGIIAPATITDSIVHYVPGMREPGAPDYPICKNFKPEIFDRVVEIMPRGNNRELFQVIRAGDRFRVVHMWLGLRETEPTRGGAHRQFIKTIRSHFINQREETVAVVDYLYDVLVDAVVDFEHPYYPGREKIRRVTDEERDAIIKGYDEEKIRGADTLFWEDVNVGDEIEPLAVGPVTIEDVAAMFAAVSGHAVAFEIQWERIKPYRLMHHTEGLKGFLDPVYNAYSGPVDHFYDEHRQQSMMYARHTGGGNALGLWPQMDGLISRMIYRWLGDDGVLKRLNTEVLFYYLHGEALHCKGKVTGKSIEGDEHLVELEVSMENHEGLVLSKGIATVRLLSRTAPTLV